MDGLSVYELQELLLNKFNYDLAVVGDSGQSSKLMLADGEKREIYGNLHYLNNLKKPPSWDGLNGRHVSVALLVYE